MSVEDARRAGERMRVDGTDGSPEPRQSVTRRPFLSRQVGFNLQVGVILQLHCQYEEMLQIIIGWIQLWFKFRFFLDSSGSVLGMENGAENKH